MDPRQIPLRDLHLPEAISWWPPAPGWWVLAIVALLLSVLLLRHWLKRRARSAARRHALRQLVLLQQDFRQHGDLVRFASELSALLRRSMLAYARRDEVAGLTGETWLEWLDRDLAQPVFAKGPGRRLLELPYRPRESGPADADVDQLVAAVRHRIATPVGAAN